MLGLLSACGGDKKDRYDYSQIAGSYQISQEDPTAGPRQITVYLIDRDTNLLLVRDTLDKLSVVKGSLDESTGLITFTDGSTCSDKATNVSCTLKGFALDIPAVNTNAVSLANLVGNYQILGGNQVYQVAIASDGKITGTTPCAVSGQVTQALSPSVNSVQLLDCQGNKIFGVLTQEKIDANTSALEVYLPDSILNGFWIQR